MTAQAVPNELPKAPVVTKAFFRAADLLQLSRQDISQIVGLSEATLSRLLTKGGAIPVESKEGEIAIYFLRLFRSLDSLFGGNEENMRLWFNSPNTYLNGTPRLLARDLQGLFHVIQYLDAMRGKV